MGIEQLECEGGGCGPLTCYFGAVDAAFLRLNEEHAKLLFNNLANQIAATSLGRIPVSGPAQELVLRSSQFLIKVSVSDNPERELIMFSAEETGKYLFPNAVGRIAVEAGGILTRRLTKDLLRPDKLTDIGYLFGDNLSVPRPSGAPPASVYIRILYSQKTGFAVATVGAVCPQSLISARTFIYRYEVDRNGFPYEGRYDCRPDCRPLQ
jgi:hypothetical protein